MRYDGTMLRRSFLCFTASLLLGMSAAVASARDPVRIESGIVEGVVLDEAAALRREACDVLDAARARGEEGRSPN